MDRTVLRPAPGGRRPTGPASAPPTPAGNAGIVAPPPAYQGFLPPDSNNALLDASAPLFALVVRFKSTFSHSDPARLRSQVADEIRAFEARAQRRGVDADSVFTARYLLCTALDEEVLNKPWGSASAWASQSLLSIFHNEVFGGERFFAILDRLSQDPGRNIDLLELIYVCLSLGFEGRYRVLDGGRDQLETVRERLYRAIRTQRGEFDPALSGRWQGVVDRRNPLIRYVPLWVVGLLAGVLLLAAYIGFSFSLNKASDPVFAQLHAIGREPPEFEKREPPPLPVVAAPVQPRPSIAAFLAPEVEQQLVTVDETDDRTTISIRGDNLFRSGRASVTETYHALIGRIAQALNTVPGNVLVTGHTDSIPIRTVRFPSNWHLSTARAEAVLQLLAATIDSATRLTAEGRGDTEPVAPNDTRENRARNRRVEILLLARASRS